MITIAHYLIIKAFQIFIQRQFLPGIFFFLQKDLKDYLVQVQDNHNFQAFHSRVFTWDKFFSFQINNLNLLDQYASINFFISLHHKSWISMDNRKVNRF